MNLHHLKKSHKLIFGLFCDLMGYVSFVFPLFDFIWAPLSAYLMTKLYKGKQGKIAAVIVFIEEALPFIDVVPTFTMMWVYTYWNTLTKRNSE